MIINSPLRTILSMHIFLLWAKQPFLDARRTERQAAIVKTPVTLELEIQSITNNIFFSKSSDILSESKPCKDENNNPGRCVSINDCDIYRGIVSNLIKKQQSNLVNRLFTKLVCGLDRQQRKAYFCCERTYLNQLQRNHSPSNLRQELLSLPTRLECGNYSPNASIRVVGGSQSTPFSWPWLAAVGKPIGHTFDVICGGTLVTKKHVLSAAHCFFRHNDRMPTHVRVGDYNLQTANDRAPHADYKIAKRQDPGFNPSTFKNDIVILTLENNIHLTEQVQLACLPILPHQQKNLNTKIVTVTGWGIRFEGSRQNSATPYEANLKILDINKCISSYSQFQNALSIDQHNLCTSSEGMDSCRGDSGGPLQYFDNSIEKYVVVGVVSFGAHCGDVNFPGVNVNLASHLQWIKSNLN